MTHHDDDTRELDEADRMVERNVAELLRRSYAPVEPDPEFAQRTRDLLLAEAARRRGGAAVDEPAGRLRVLPWIATLAAAVLLGALLWASSQSQGPRDAGEHIAELTGSSGLPGFRVPDEGSAARGVQGALSPAQAPERSELPRVGQGDELRTGADDRSRVRLPDGSVVALDHETTLRVVGLRRLELLRGRVFVEVDPAENHDGRELVVVGGGRDVVAKGTRFELHAAPDALSVTVAEGLVAVEGVTEPVSAGRRLTLDERGTPSTEWVPDVADALAWLRETLPDSPLVADSGEDRSGIVVVDTDGQDVNLSLRKYHVDVHVEDGFARTTIDQTFFNHLWWRTEGTFRFPLPAGASISRLAMYVAGARMEAGMATRDHAREVYEQIRWTRRDPALLEWVDGSTFKLRVFPLEPREEKRLLLSYTEPLRADDGAFRYRFPGGHDQPVAGRWSVRIRVVDGAIDGTRAPRGYEATVDGDDLILTAEAENVVPTADLDVALGRTTDAPELHRHRTDDGEYAMVRVPLTFDAASDRRRRDWVVLFEASGSRSPLLARAQIELVRQVLANASHDDTVRVLTADVAPEWLGRGAVPVHPANVELLADWLGDTHLVGALDLEAALREADRACARLENPVLLHVGGGVGTLGESDPGKLAALVEHGQYVGLAVGKRWSRELMRGAASATGGSFRQVLSGDDLAWTGFEVVAGLDAPRLIGASVEGGDADWLLDADVVEHGDELLAYAKFSAGAEVPDRVTIHGTVGGQAYGREVELEVVDGTAGYLPRAWARLEIDRLVAEDAVGHKERIEKLSHESWVMSPFTSLIVLETEQMYRDQGIDQGTPDGWAAYEAPDEIPVVREWNGRWGRGVTASGSGTREEVLNSLFLRFGPYVLQNSDGYGWQPSGYLSYRDWWQNRHAYGRRAWTRGWNANESLGLPVNASRRLSGAFFNDGIDGDYRARTENVFDLPLAVTDAMREAAEEPVRLDASAPFLGRTTTATVGLDAMRRFVPGMSDVGVGGSAGGGLALRQLQWAQSAGKKSAELWLGDADAPFFGSRPGSGPAAIRDELLDFETLVAGDYYGHYGWYDPFQRFIHQSPTFTWNWQTFRDLPGYAPGMLTWWEDVAAHVERHATDVQPVPMGKVTAAARELIERSRTQGWRRVRVGDDELVAAIDGRGRLRLERTTALGLREVVVCDGETLTHAYPELGIATAREPSRFHLARLWNTLPVFLPDVEFLARGRNVSVEGRDTLVLTPLDGGDELRIVLDAELRPVARIQAGFSERLVDGARVRTGPDVNARTPFEIEPAAAPELGLDRTRLVTLRTPVTNGYQVPSEYGSLSDDRAEELLSQLLAQNWMEAAKLLAQRGWLDGDKGRGGWVLLCGTGWHWDPETADVAGWKHERFDPRDGLPDDPVAAHLSDTLASMRGFHPETYEIQEDAPPFVAALSRFAAAMSLQQRGHQWQDIARFHDLCITAAEQTGVSDVGWAALQTAFAYGANADGAPDRLVAALEPYVGVPGFDRYARYEQAAVLTQVGRREEARRLLLGLHDEWLAEGALLPIDHRFASAFQHTPEAVAGWQRWVDEVVDALVERERPRLLVLFRYQLHQVGQAAVSERIVTRLEDLLPQVDDGLRLATNRLRVFVDLRQGYTASAERLAERMAEQHPDRADAWWTLVQTRLQLGKPAVNARERALELSVADLGDVVDLAAVRAQYGALLGEFLGVARALRTARVEPNAELLARVARAADHWRSLDPDPTGACRYASQVFAELGREDLAWTYATTPLDALPSEPEPWLELARHLNSLEHVELASRAYARAFELDPIDGAILFEHAELHWQRGDRETARPLLERLADGDFGERFAAQVQQARARLGR